MNALFLRQYLKNIRSIGAITPSSRFLARKMLASINFKDLKLIIEYGPGTGVFTREIVEHLNPDAILLVIETNPVFCEKLRAMYRNHSNIEIINASAADADLLRKERKLPNPDYIISGLPFAALPHDVSQAILKNTKQLLGKRGEFITFQYTLLKMDLFTRYFSDIQTSRELRNIPPAYILHCKQK